MPYLYYILLFILGLCVGSFLNAWTWRIRENLSIVHGRSMCTKCRRRIYWFDNIPLVSFLVLKRHCRFCNEKISWQYPLVELGMGVAFLFVAIINHGGEKIITPELIRDLVVVFFLAFIFVYDLRYKEILDFTTVYPAFFLFFVNLALGWQNWQSMLLGITAGAGFFLLLFVLSQGRWIGGGDVRFGLFMGVLLGWPNILVALMIAYISGAFISLVLLALKKKKLTSETPFGTYLALATFVCMFWGNMIVDWYLGLLR